MDPPDSLQFCRLGNTLLEVLSGEADTEEKLRAIASFDKELFIRPWLKERRCVALFIAELAKVRKALVANLYGVDSQAVASHHASATAELPTQASATAELPAQVSATAKLPGQDSARAELPAQASATAELPAQASATAERPAQASATAKLPAQTHAAVTAELPVQTHAAASQSQPQYLPVALSRRPG